MTVDSRLLNLGAELDYPATPDFSTAVLRDISASRAPGRRRLLVAVAVVVATVTVVAALIPGVRETVKAWLGIGGVVIERVGPLDSSPTTVSDSVDSPLSGLSLGDPATLQEAASVIGMAVPASSMLGDPDAVYIDAQRATLTFGSQAPDETLLVTVFRGDLEPAILKQLPGDARLELVTINGEDGIWISGEPHAVLFFDEQGGLQEESGRLVGNSLLWEAGVLTLRLEGVVDVERAIEIAESFRS